MQGLARREGARAAWALTVAMSDLKALLVVTSHSSTLSQQTLIREDCTRGEECWAASSHGHFATPAPACHSL